MKHEAHSVVCGWRLASRKFQKASKCSVHSAVVALSALACYLNSLKCGLVFDDVAAIKENRDVRTRTPLVNLLFNDFWGTPIHKEESHKSYRPICTLTFRLNYALHSYEPFGYHLANVILHCVVCVLFYRLCLLFISRKAGFIASVLFAVHPIHSEAVTGVVGRAELLSAFFYLSALTLYIKRTKTAYKSGIFYDCIPVLLTIIGTLCKEQCLTVLPLCAIYELREFRKNYHGSKCWKADSDERKSLIIHATAARLSVLAIGFAIILSFRFWIVGSKLPIFSRFDNPASVSGTQTRVMTYNFLLALNAWLLFCPSSLCCDWTMGSVPLVAHFPDPRNLATIATYSAFAYIVYVIIHKQQMRKKSTALLMGLSMTVIPFLPASNLLFPVGFVVAERVLYLPSMGFCLLVASGYDRLSKHHRWKKIQFAMISLLLCFTLKTISRNEDWVSEKSLFSSGLLVNKKNPKLLNNFGRALENLGRHEEALNYYRKSISLEPNDVRGYLNYGKALSFLGRYAEAEEIFLQAKSLLPSTKDPLPSDLRLTTSHLHVFLNLAALIAKNQSRLTEADEVFREALKLRSDFSKAYMGRGQLLQIMNRTDDAELMYSKAMREEKHNADLYNNYGQMLLDLGRTNEALTYFSKALDIDPDHKNTLLNLALFVQESRSPWAKTYALSRLEAGATRGTPNETLCFRIGMASLAHKDKVAAEKWFLKALKIQPMFRSALYNLALLLSEQDRPTESIPILLKLLKYHPNHVKGLLLLGDLYVNHEKNLEKAQECYEKILFMEPKNVQARHNLCVVILEMGALLEAEACFQEAYNYHPEVEYIRNNLKTIQSMLLNSKATVENKKANELINSSGFQKKV